MSYPKKENRPGNALNSQFPEHVPHLKRKYLKDVDRSAHIVKYFARTYEHLS